MYSIANPIRLVLADSSAIVRAGIKRLLSEMPEIKIVAECEDSASAIAAIRETHPDLVFTDFILGSGTAVDVLRAARAMQPRPISIVHTLQTDASTRAISYACGADVFYDKSRDLTPLLNMLRKLSQVMMNADALQAA
ncbi:MAG TPA: response regulator [Chthoniobacteraceae bacterium]|jgi:DNA-binding NarL/FixJ family response regulator|nr:response regulator [Chthoniobacteraceae bacterium]